MAYPARSQRKVTSALLPIATAALATVIFVADWLTPTGVAVAGLYVAVVLTATRFVRRGVVLVAVGCAVLTVPSYLLARPGGPEAEEGAVNALISIAAISVAAFLASQGQSADVTLRDLAGAAVASDYGEQLDTLHGGGQGIAFFNRARPETAAQVVGGLVESAKAESLAQRGQERVARSGLWRHRAEQLVDFVEGR
jgi:hypothetical protein